MTLQCVAMPSPWLAVTAAEYEEHMGPDGVDQLGPLSGIFGHVYRSVRPRSLLVPGCGPGAGLEHVDPSLTRRAIGIDLNIQYVTVARQRYRHLGPALELYCADALHARLQPEADFDLVHVSLLFEHVDPGELARAIGAWVAPGGACAVVLQRPLDEVSGAAAVHDSIRRVEDRMALVEPAAVAELLAAEGLRRVGSWETRAGAGARFHVGVFRAGPARPVR